MDHCRGFLRGIGRGCFIGPMVGVALAGLSFLFDSESYSSEFGPLGDLLAGIFGGVPLGAVVGGFVGAIHDALRLKDLERWIVVVCLLPIVLVCVVVPVVVSWGR